MATVFIIDDDASVRKSLSRLLRSEGIRSECFDSANAFLARQKRDGIGCILLDINMPEMSGTELQARLVEVENELPVIFLTGHADVHTSVAAMKRGATDFLTKPVDESELLQAIFNAIERHRHLRNESRKRDLVLDRIALLTPREVDVMHCLITGAPNKLVANDLQIALKTVKVHRAHIMEKMGVRSVAELVHLCHIAGIEPDSDDTPG